MKKTQKTQSDGVILNPIATPENSPTSSGYYSGDEKSSLNSGSEEKTPETQKKIRKWSFTLNNYTEKDWLNIKENLTNARCKYIIGREIAPSTGTKHIQGFVAFENARTFLNVKKLLGDACHIETTRSSFKINVLYCSKEGDYETNIVSDILQNDPISLTKKRLNEQYKNTVWKAWQFEILKIINNKPDNRKIHWFWEPKGNTGKSFLTKYIALNYSVIICSGKKNDIYNQVNTNYQKGVLPYIVIVDVPRTSFDYLNYTAIEELKNGLIYSGKYEGGVCIFDTPHVIVLANSEPEKEALSQDRWDIHKINN